MSHSTPTSSTDGLTDHSVPLFMNESLALHDNRIFHGVFIPMGDSQFGIYTDEGDDVLLQGSVIEALAKRDFLGRHVSVVGRLLSSESGFQVVEVNEIFTARK